MGTVWSVISSECKDGNVQFTSMNYILILEFLKLIIFNCSDIKVVNRPSLQGYTWSSAYSLLSELSDFKNFLWFLFLKDETTYPGCKEGKLLIKYMPIYLLCIILSQLIVFTELKETV